jgi:leader peptidase (prepilin peptidase) / N-methyltransferase
VSPSLLAVVIGAALVGAVGGVLVPRVIAALPEPDPEAPAADAARKPLYVDIAASPGLARWSAVAAAAACGAAAFAVRWSMALPIWIYLGVVGVALAYVDWRTRLLPTRLIAPSYAVVAVLAVLASATTGDWAALLRAALGWALAGGLYFVLWFVYPRGMGYGDVRLSGVLGIALGWLGWAELVVGIYAGFLLGAIVGGGLALAKVVDRRRYAFGPFMLAGALVGVLWGETAARWYTGA